MLKILLKEKEETFRNEKEKKIKKIGNAQSSRYRTNGDARENHVQQFTFLLVRYLGTRGPWITGKQARSPNP